MRPIDPVTSKPIIIGNALGCSSESTHSRTLFLISICGLSEVLVNTSLLSIDLYTVLALAILVLYE